MPAAEQNAFEFFSGLSGRLDIASLRIRWRAFEDDGLRDVTEEEWSRVAVQSSSLLMTSADGTSPAIEHRAADGVAFTVRDLARAVEETERKSRVSTSAAQHAYFEGLEKRDGTYAIRWGA